MREFSFFDSLPDNSIIRQIPFGYLAWSRHYYYPPLFGCRVLVAPPAGELQTLVIYRAARTGVQQSNIDRMRFLFFPRLVLLVKAVAVELDSRKTRHECLKLVKPIHHTMCLFTRMLPLPLGDGGPSFSPRRARNRTRSWNVSELAKELPVYLPSQ